MIQRLADFEEQWHGYPLRAVGFVDVFGSTMHLPSEPCGSAALPGEFGFEKLSEMEIGWGLWCFCFHSSWRFLTGFRPCQQAMKKGAHLSFHCLSSWKALVNRDTDKHEKVCA